MTPPMDGPTPPIDSIDATDRLGVLLEEYLQTPDARNAEMRHFAETHADLIRVAEALRASWRADLTERGVEVPPPLVAAAGSAHEASTGRARRVAHHDVHDLRMLPPKSKPVHYAGGGRGAAREVWYAFATIMVGVLGLVVGLRVHKSRSGSAIEKSSTVYTTYTTANGQRATITLPDGSTVVLNVASQLAVPADYAAGHRALRLQGEALFNVRHRADHAFTVTAGAMTARVLGTSFVVRHYATDTATTVAVRDGKVAAHSSIVTAAEQATIDRYGRVFVGHADPTQFSFVTGVLTLNDVPLSEAIVELDRWYDADIRLGNPKLAEQRVTGECAAGSLADLTDVLQWTFNVRVVRNERTITLYPR